MERENINRTLKIAVEGNGSKMIVRFSAGFTGRNIYIPTKYLDKWEKKIGLASDTFAVRQ